MTPRRSGSAGALDDRVAQRAPGSADSIDGISVVDTERRMRYGMLRDKDDDRCYCDDHLADTLVPPGRWVTLSGSFPAPPAAVDELDVFLPRMGTLHDVAVERSG
jgi:hypothetical protein